MRLIQFSLCLLVLAAALCFQGCSTNLNAKFAEGFSLVILPEDSGTVIWDMSEDAAGATPRWQDLGGGFKAVALAPGLYSLKAVYNVSYRGLYGQRDKDLDYGARMAHASGLPAERITPKLGLVQVRRGPIKEERNVGKDWDSFVREIPSSYKMTLNLAGLAGKDGKNFAYFELKPGEVILLPQLSGTIKMNELACERWGSSVSRYATYENPALRYVLSDNPEDFLTIKWLCPVEILLIGKTPASLEDAKAKISPSKLSPELLEKLEVRDIQLGQRFMQADDITKDQSGGEQYIFVGP